MTPCLDIFQLELILNHFKYFKSDLDAVKITRCTTGAEGNIFNERKLVLGLPDVKMKFKNESKKIRNSLNCQMTCDFVRNI